MNRSTDELFLLAYTTDKNRQRNGLHFAWSRDRQQWHAIGPEHTFVRCDYGNHATEKKLRTPFLARASDGLWHCIWSVNETDAVFAHATTPDLINWRPQRYIKVAGPACLDPVLERDAAHSFRITYRTSTGDFHQMTTNDLLTFSAPRTICAFANPREQVTLAGAVVTGQVVGVSRAAVDALLRECEWRKYRTALHAERAADDAVRFRGLRDLDATLVVDPARAKAISDMLIGVFFEDLNWAADGGLYAELVRNRDFEYEPADCRGQDPAWNATYAWSIKGSGSTLEIAVEQPIHANNPHYAVLKTGALGAALVNTGFDGIPVRQGEAYDFSAFVRSPGGAAKFKVRLVNARRVVAESDVECRGEVWTKVSATLTAAETASDCVLELWPQERGELHLDLVSLFPRNTFKGRKNGLRADLAQAIADLKPRFVRFPGGCLVHGDGLSNMYRWKNTVGPLDARKPQPNIWGYHQTAGLGYFEYFQFCEDIGAEPLPVLPAGVPCQNSACGGAGQQGGIPMDEMPAYVQEVLDLVEYANGPADSKWGSVRAAAGHPEPFGLKYIGIGNEDLIGDVFEPRYEMIVKALMEKHPEITVVGTVGPFCEGADYEAGWEIARRLRIPIVDEHYYMPPAWFIYNQDFYDKYERGGPKVYLGEYAAHVPSRASTLEAALAEALHIVNMERNGDVVEMASYAPLLAREGRVNWKPDLIYFNATDVKPTVSYFVQQLCGQNAGGEYLSNVLSIPHDDEKVRSRVAASAVRDRATGDVILKLVNLLPVRVNTGIRVDTGVSSAVATVLAGQPDDERTRPETFALSVVPAFDFTLKPYSFSVIRLRAASPAKHP